MSGRSPMKSIGQRAGQQETDMMTIKHPYALPMQKKKENRIAANVSFIQEHEANKSPSSSNRKHLGLRVILVGRKCTFIVNVMPLV